MSLHEYQVSQVLSQHDLPFYALIMAAMRRADTNNLQHLKNAWPSVWHELEWRYNALDGILPYDER